jgi:integrase
MSPGKIFKRCSCVNPATGRRYGPSCPDLRRSGGTAWSATHGTFHFQLELPARPGQPRRQLRRGGYTTRDEAQEQLDHARDLLALAGGDPIAACEIGDLLAAVKKGRPLPDVLTVARRVGAGISASATVTVGDFLQEWLAGHGDIADSTRQIYAGHIRLYLTPHLGHIPLDGLRIGHIQAMFTAITTRNQDLADARRSTDPAVRAGVRGQRMVGTASMQRIRATLRKALNDAIAPYRLIEFNPAAHIRLRSGDRPHARVWDASAVKRWQATGERPSPVMVWLPDDAGRFLDYAESHDIALYPMFALILSRGLRRGEACGIRDMDINLDDATLTVSQQLTTCGYKPVVKPVKTRSGERGLGLDRHTVAIQHAYQARRARWRLASGPAWPDTGLWFVQPNGQPWHPDTIGNRFTSLVQGAGLPPVRLHDLRHCAASYLRLAGADMKTVQETLGHSSSVITADTYTTVFQRFEEGVTDTAADLIHRNRRTKAA